MVLTHVIVERESDSFKNLDFEEPQQEDFEQAHTAVNQND